MLLIRLFVPIRVQQFDVKRGQLLLAVAVMAAPFGVKTIPSGILLDRTFRFSRSEIK